jgi:thiol-disulfide isomerase/thioredoxin
MRSRYQQPPSLRRAAAAHLLLGALLLAAGPRAGLAAATAGEPTVAAEPGRAVPPAASAAKTVPPALAAPRTLPPGWRSLAAPLPAFDLADVDGKRWRLEDLRGRRLYVIGWATWCGYCRQQLPLVEELRKQVAGCSDVTVLTLNVDHDPSLVKPYLAERDLAFPSLLAGEWFARYTDGSVPRGWIVDAEGVVRFEQSGFARQLAPRWVGDTLGLLQGLAEPPGSSC